MKNVPYRVNLQVYQPETRFLVSKSSSDFDLWNGTLPVSGTSLQGNEKKK